MKKHRGSVLLGYSHTSQDSAESIIAELKANGIKEGDLVAVEHTPESLEFIKSDIESGSFNKIIGSLNIRLGKFEADLLKTRGMEEIQSLNSRRKRLKHYIGKLSFIITLYSFLFSKNVKFLPYDSKPALRRLYEMELLHSLMRAHGEKIPNKEKTKEEFLLLPIREKYWRKSLKGQNPRFVLTGETHLGIMKKILPYEKAINLRRENLTIILKERAKINLIRFRYNASRVWAKFKRRIKIRLTGG